LCAESSEACLASGWILDQHQVSSLGTWQDGGRDREFLGAQILTIREMLA